MQKPPLLLLLIVILSSLDIVAGQQEEHWCSQCKLRERKEFSNDPLLCHEIVLSSLFSITITTKSLSDKYGGIERFAPGWTKKGMITRSSSKQLKRTEPSDGCDRNEEGNESVSSPIKKRQKRKKCTDGYKGEGDKPASPIKPRKKKKRITESKSLDDLPDTSWDDYFNPIKVVEIDFDLVPVVTACGDRPPTCLPLSNLDQFGWSSEEEDATE